jgi:trimeric autotransporter adhesin
MNRTFRALAGALLPAAAALTLSTPAAAQSDILLQLRSGSPPGDRFRVDSAGGFVAIGNLGIGIIPFSGAGYRTMWHPFKAAFRSGYADVSGEWDEANVGFFSWAGGYTTKASGIYSFAFGDGAEATAQLAWATGSNSEAIGTASWAGGVQAKARNLTSFSWGNKTWAGNSFRGATNVQGGATAIGYLVTADADWSTALGFRATTAGQVGSFVWGGTLSGASAATDSITATSAGQFAARAPGGFRFRTNQTLTTGCDLPAGSGVFSCASSRFLKHGFVSVDGEDLLARIRQVPVTTWSYDAEGSRVRHMGPFAEDFRAAFGLGTDDRSIGLLDIDGVNFAGVQALERRTAELRDAQARLEARDRRIDELEARLARIEALLAAPEQ